MEDRDAEPRTGPTALCISLKSPVPPVSGSRQRIRNLIEAMAMNGDVHLLILGRLDQGEAEALAAWGCCSVEVVALAARRPGLRGTLAWLRGRGPVDSHRKVDVAAARQRIAAVIAERAPSVVWVPGASSEAYLPAELGAPLVVEVSNVEHVTVSRERAALVRRLRSLSGLKLYARLVLGGRARHRAECRLWERAAMLVPVSEAEAVEARQRSRAAVVVVPNGVDVPDHPRRAPGSGRMIFVGNLHYLPNADAVRWMAKEILPRIRAVVPGATFEVVGTGPDSLRAEAEGPGVHWNGFVDDLDALYASVEVAVAPLRAGSGTKLKVIEALAYEVPLVSTSIGMEGIPNETGVVADIADSADAFAQAVVALFRDPERADAMAARARSLAVEHYSWAAIQHQFAEAVRDLLGSPTR